MICANERRSRSGDGGIKREKVLDRGVIEERGSTQ